METFEKSMKVMNELFARDYQFALATANNNIPSVRFVDTYYDNHCFYIVTYAGSKKVKELELLQRRYGVPCRLFGKGNHRIPL